MPHPPAVALVRRREPGSRTDIDLLGPKRPGEPVSEAFAATIAWLTPNFQPLMSIAVLQVVVTSNQSAPYGLLPLLHGDTSEITTDDVPWL